MTAHIDEFRMPRYREIPDVGLYLDQTVKYINGYLAPLGCMEITTSMVSNYVKKGYIESPVRKQYDADRIVYLFFIAIAKSVLSMENIARLFDMQKKSYSVEVAYDYFCTELENMLAYTFGLREQNAETGLTNSLQKTMLRSTIIAVTHIIYLSSQFDALGEDTDMTVTPRLPREAEAEPISPTTQSRVGAPLFPMDAEA